MGETLSASEVAHELSHHKHGVREGRIEILEAILLAVVAVATAWSGYQTARWDGRQAHLYGLSNKERLTALAQRFKVHGVRVALLAVAGCLLLGALYYVVTYPVA